MNAATVTSGRSISFSRCSLPISPSQPSSPFLSFSLLPIKKHKPLLIRPRLRCRRLATKCSSISVPQTLGNRRADSGFFGRLLSFLPGGNWWNLEQIGEVEERKQGNVEADEAEEQRRSLSIVGALGRMWVLVAKDRWVIFLAFASLACASVTNFQIPIADEIYLFYRFFFAKLGAAYGRDFSIFIPKILIII